jgi:tetratricopeptide (TPR) repeat protein
MHTTSAVQIELYAHWSRTIGHFRMIRVLPFASIVVAATLGLCVCDIESFAANSKFACEGKQDASPSSIKPLVKNVVPLRLPPSGLRMSAPTLRSSDDPAAAGMDAISKGNWNEAIEKLSEHLSAHPDNSSAYTWRGYARFQLGDANYALADLNQAVLIDPKNIDALTIRAWARCNVGDYDGSLFDCNESLRIKPSAMSYSVRGQDLYAAGKLVDAAHNEDQSLLLDSSQSLPWQVKGLCAQAMGDVTTAIADFGKAIEANASNSDAYVYRSRCRMFADDYTQALVDLNAAAKISADDPTVLLYRTLANLGLRNLDAAKADAQTCVKQDPKSALSHRVLAYVYEESGDPSSALSEYSSAAERYLPGDDRLEMTNNVQRLKQTIGTNPSN